VYCVDLSDGVRFDSGNATGPADSRAVLSTATTDEHCTSDDQRPGSTPAFTCRSLAHSSLVHSTPTAVCTREFEMNRPIRIYVFGTDTVFTLYSQLYNRLGELCK